MPSRKPATRDRAIVRLPTEPIATSKLPPALQFFLVVLLSFSASYVLFSTGSVFTAYELSTVSRTVNDAWQVLIFPVWRVIELAVGWYAHYDDYDMASLTLQTRLPFYYLLTTFYDISFLTSGLCLMFDVISAALPFYMLRRRIPAHDPDAPAGSVTNRSIIQDFPIFLLTTTFAASVYSVIVYTSFATWLPVYMVTHFDDVKSFKAAHAAQLPALVLTFFPIGWAARTFLFAPATGAQTNLGDIRAKAFNPETATLSEHVQHNFWGWSKGTKVLIQRAIVLATMVGLTTWIRVWKTIEGSEGWGAAGWAGLWAFASLINGLVLRWVGDV